MKKLFFFALAVLGMTAACQKPDVKVENPDLDDNAPVEVVFGVNAPTITVTKTKAAVDDWAADHTVYVYGFDKSLTSLESVDGKSPMLINGEAANVVTPTGTDSDLTAADESGLKFGNHEDGITEKKFYYEVDAVYDFVGYYTGKINETDSKPVAETVTPTGKSLTAEVTIDGSNDVMLAAATPANDIDKANINLKVDRVYSAFAARRNVHPTLNFEHMLTRFSFYVVEGKTPNTTTKKTVNVTKVATTTTNQGTLTIAPIAEQKFEKAANATAELSIKGIAAGGQTPTTTKEKLGEDIMIFPGDKEVTFYVSLVPTESADPNLSGITLEPMEVELSAADITGTTDATFLAGTKYNVILTVYGLEQVQVSASLAEWDEVPEWTYDPDDDYADQVIISELKVTKDGASEETSLYHNAKTFKDGVTVYKDKALTEIAEAGDYTVTTDNATFTVTDDGKVSNYTPATQQS